MLAVSLLFCVHLSSVSREAAVTLAGSVLTFLSQSKKYAGGRVSISVILNTSTYTAAPLAVCNYFSWI